MKSLSYKKVLPLLLFIFLIQPLYCNTISVNLGIHDFVNDTSWQLYKLIPQLSITHGFFLADYSGIELSIGIAGKEATYNDSSHVIIFVPMHLSYSVNFSNSKFNPFISAGVSSYYSSDYNDTLKIEYDALSYGYHFAIGSRKEFDKFNLVFRIQYLLVKTTFYEEFDTSGISTLIGLEYRY